MNDEQGRPMQGVPVMIGGFRPPEPPRQLEQPPQVIEQAFRFIEVCLDVTEAEHHVVQSREMDSISAELVTTKGRELRPEENRTRLAALQLLERYFGGDLAPFLYAQGDVQVHLHGDTPQADDEQGAGPRAAIMPKPDEGGGWKVPKPSEVEDAARRVAEARRRRGQEPDQDR
jgi:hypothetical protein